MYAVAYKGVCYQCSYEGRTDTSSCPVCRFPLIMEPENTPPGGFRLEDILDRPTVREGAPPLPGVDPGKRKAQIMAEARRDRMRAVSDRQHVASSSVEHTSLVRVRPPRRQPMQEVPQPHLSRVVPHPDDVLDGIPTDRRWVALRYTVLCVSAVAAGILAAVLQSS
jgi:hypothetical protein